MINFSPLEDIAVEIEDNYVIIGIHNRALNQNPEGYIQLFERRSSASKLSFRPTDKATWL
jgi:hypothetical protein